MRLNTLSPAPGRIKSKKRVGRGVGSGFGKTCGRGHKGLKSRSGGSVRPGFEGGQMPLQKRLPKFGFTSRIGRVSAEIRLSELNKIGGDVANIETLKAAGLINASIIQAKIFLSGELSKAITIEGLAVTKGAKAAIEAAGGTIQE
ncbi:MAG: large subunit ribosomal protein L15 [Flavobacteriales bacterium]|jgi:large subunit ribosomal protein L15